MQRKQLKSRRRVIGISAFALVGGGTLASVIYDMTLNDFLVPGSQPQDVNAHFFMPSMNCGLCHGDFDEENDPYSTWSGTKMALAGKNPLFFAQMTLANQDVANVGNYCLRCHVPMSVVSGSVNTPDGSDLSGLDLEGVSCQFCHSMIDPIYKPGVSPAEDEAILAGLDQVPAFYGNAMFVVDPNGSRRGPRSDSFPPHELIESPFHRQSAFCGTCHDVGNVATTRLADGTYQYNALDTPSPTDDPHQMFPLERTYTEWKLSAFAQDGVALGGRFGGEGADVVRSCQDCHMPKVSAMACVFGPERDDMRRHEFAGAGAQVLDIIALHTQNDPDVDQEAIGRARQAAISMLQRAATLEVAQRGDRLMARVVNESGHKLPTGHIEGRRVWVNVQFLNEQDQIVDEIGHYDYGQAHLDEEGTTIFEMHVGLSEAAASATGLDPGLTTRMALADVIVKDNRIPPRGWDNESYIAGGAPAVGEYYPDGQHWHDSWYGIVPDAVRARVIIYYQNTPRHYIEVLRDGNVTDHWGQTLYGLWEKTGRGEPILMTSVTIDLRCPADFAEPNGELDYFDVSAFINAYRTQSNDADIAEPYGSWDVHDLLHFLDLYQQGCS